MKIKTLKTITFCAFVFCGISASAQTPVYLDKNQSVISVTMRRSRMGRYILTYWSICRWLSAE